ncbi:FxSxx-COOH system tetratricopeptide repeat protein [Actinoplanes italicus]|uniref:FxSxx-COOH system tetratricopeptide repeat protein n=1 Tax=Actinoplanes italicus TaxID=113567 RepID=UPI001475B05D|nr:FxSxx-COOH system tetratricopeptide repeat protein [Actinoplanes italicus]
MPDRIVISHTGKDRDWAQWARWHLEAAGYRTELDSVDRVPGTNVVEAMHRALSRDNPLLVLLSAEYLGSDEFATDEWTARFAQRRRDPAARLIPLRVENVDLSDGIWAPIVVADVFDLTPDRATAALLDAVRRAVDAGPPEPLSVVPPQYPGRAEVSAGTDGPRPVKPLPVVWNLARRNTAFTGRDGMLDRLRDALSNGSRVAVQALYGMGGVGKTQLALEYAHRFADDYDLVWWIPSEQPELIADHLAALAQDEQLRLVPPDTPTPQAVKALRDHLRRVGRWLLIFDNAEDREDLFPWLPDGPGHLLITSRNPNWTGIAEAVDVDVFARAESVALLRTHLPHLAEADADRLADALGDLPLGVGQAVDLLAETGMPVQDYLDDLAAHTAELMSEGRPPAGYPVSLAATVTLTADHLCDTAQAAGQLLYMCAQLGSETIPIDLFTASPELLPEPLNTTVRRPLAFRRVLGQLGRHGLARLTTSGPVLHRLVQAVLRDTDPNSAMHLSTVENLLAAAGPDDATHPKWWPRWTALLPHILAVNPATTENRDLCSAATGAIWHLLARGDAQMALPLAEFLHQSWIAKHGPDDLIVLNISESLAAAHTALGNYRQAYELDQDMFVRRRGLYGADSPLTLNAARNLAIDLSDLGELGQAQELNEDTLARSRRVLGDDHPDTLTSASHLAADLSQLGEFERARELDEDTLARRRRVLGDDHPDTLTSASNLAVDFTQLGEFEGARELDEDTLARRRRVLGDDHPGTLTSASNLAVDFFRLGEFEGARELDEDTLARRRRVLGDDHPDTLTSAGNLALDLEALDRADDARVLRRRFKVKS